MGTQHGTARRSNQQPIGKRLAGARMTAGRQIEWVAAELGVGANTVRRWESGEIDMPAQRIADYARLFGLSMELVESGGSK